MLAPAGIELERGPTALASCCTTRWRYRAEVRLEELPGHPLAAAERRRRCLLQECEEPVWCQNSSALKARAPGVAGGDQPSSHPESPSAPALDLRRDVREASDAIRAAAQPSAPESGPSIREHARSMHLAHEDRHHAGTVNHEIGGPGAGHGERRIAPSISNGAGARDRDPARRGSPGQG